MRNTIILVGLFVSGIAVALLGCEPASNITPQPVANQNFQLPAMEWRIRDKAALRTAYVEISGQCLAEGEEIEGFTGLDPNGRQVIYTLPPKRVDDSATLTLGHELMHVALGKHYHVVPIRDPTKPVQCG